MFSIFLSCSPGEEDLLTAELWAQETAGITEEPGGLRAFFDDEARASRIIRYFHNWSPQVRTEPNTDWQKVTEDAWPPMPVGDRFFLVPPWRADPAPDGRLRLEIYPGMACGTGRHPCTQLCLEAMESIVKPEAAVVDVGAGSGILSSAALLLGAGQIIACDIDHEAAAIAKQRVNVPVFTGTLDAVQSNFADVIIANISSAAVEELRPEFDRVRKSGRSTLILSGFPEWDGIEGFRVTRRLQREEWLCIVSSNF